RGEVNDAGGAAAGDHRLGGVLGCEHPGGGEAQHRLVPVFDLHIEDGRPVDLAGGVHHAVDGTVALDRFRHHAGDVILHERVAGERQRIEAAAGQVAGRLGGDAAVDVGDCDAGALA